MTELVHVPHPEQRRRINVRPYAAGTVRVTAEAIRTVALLAFVITPAAALTPEHGWRPEAPSWALAVVLLALLGVERIGLALHELSESIAHPAPYTPHRPKHPAH